MSVLSCFDGSPAAQVCDSRENIEDQRQRGDVHRKPLTFRTLQPNSQDPLRRSKVRQQEVKHEACKHQETKQDWNISVPLPAGRRTP